MSTNTHEESKTCMDIVNWLSRATASVERATLAARVAGKTHETTADWLAARADARAAEDEAITLLCQVAPQSGAAAAVLRNQGYTWSDNLAVWLPPAPNADAQRAKIAEATLLGMGYEWAAKRQMWVCTRPDADVPVKFTAAASSLQAAGLSWEAAGQVWTGPVLDPMGHERLKQAAELAVSVRYRNGPAAQQDAAVSALVDALGVGDRPAFPPTWDAEECRNAALEVLRAARGEDFSPLLSKALTRLAAAVQREQ